MSIRWRDEDPGLPIDFKQCSNGSTTRSQGWNAVNLYGIDPITESVGFTREDLELARAEHPVPTRSWGPRTVEEVRELRAHHRGWP